MRFDTRETNVLQAGQSFQLARCPKCQLVFTNPKPQPELLTQLYSDNGYYSYQKFFIPELVPAKGLANKCKRWLKAAVIDHYYGYGHRRNDFKSNLWLNRLGGAVKWLVKDDIVSGSRIISYVKNGTHLDIGCGSGGFVYWMKENGWNSFGLELNISAVELAHQLGLNVEQSEIENAGLSEGQFDLITAWEVMEHISDLRRFLQEVHRVLTPEGKFVGSVPNIASTEAFIFGKYWQPLEIPYHLSHFSPASLKNIFEMSGFRLEKLEFLKITHSWDASLDKRWPPDTWHLPLLRVLGRPFYLLSNAAGCGARIKFIAMKRI